MEKEIANKGYTVGEVNFALTYCTFLKMYLIEKIPVPVFLTPYFQIPIFEIYSEY